MRYLVLLLLVGCSVTPIKQRCEIQFDVKENKKRIAQGFKDNTNINLYFDINCNERK